MSFLMSLPCSFSGFFQARNAPPPMASSTSQQPTKGGGRRGSTAHRWKRGQSNTTPRRRECAALRQRRLGLVVLLWFLVALSRLSWLRGLFVVPRFMVEYRVCSLHSRCFLLFRSVFCVLLSWVHSPVPLLFSVGSWCSGDRGNRQCSFTRTRFGAGDGAKRGFFGFARVRRRPSKSCESVRERSLWASWHQGDRVDASV